MDFDLGDSAADVDDDEPADASEDESAATTDSNARLHDSATPSTADPRTTPAFEFDETTQRPIYVREDTMQRWERARRLDIERVFIDHDVEDVRKSEIHDALLRLAADNPEKVAEAVLEERGLLDD